MENIERIMQSTLENLRSMISTDTVIGKSFKGPDDSLIIPISKVSVGFVAGGAEYSESPPKVKENDFPHAGGGGAGMSIVPMAFLVCDKHSQELIMVDKEETLGKWADLIPAIVKSLTKK